MKRFLLKISVVLVIAISIHLLAAFFANGRTDAFYLRFTGTPQHSMIIGTSRSAQGIVPEGLDDVMGELGYDGPIYNFSFTRIASPFGKVYYEAIKEKLDTSSRHGLFIISVEPVAICDDTMDAASPHREEEQMLATTRSFNASPNIDYLVQNYTKGWGNMVLDGFDLSRTNMVLSHRGWLEVDIPMDSASVARRAAVKIREHKALVGKYVVSATRMNYLDSTIKYLSTYGNVYLVRLPISKEICGIEDIMVPGFDAMMTAVALQHRTSYLNMNDMAGNFSHTDGHHIARKGAIVCTDSIAHWIKSNHKPDRSAPQMALSK